MTCFGGENRRLSWFSQAAAIDDQHLAGDPPGGIGEQVDHGTRHILGLNLFAKGRLRGVVVKDLLRLDPLLLCTGLDVFLVPDLLKHI